jgi:hypothetical protein
MKRVKIFYSQKRMLFCRRKPDNIFITLFCISYFQSIFQKIVNKINVFKKQVFLKVLCHFYKNRFKSVTDRLLIILSDNKIGNLIQINFR